MKTNEILDTIDNGESEVQLTTIGTIIGTAKDGSPVEQNLTEEGLKKLAELHKDDEILVDADHESEMGGKTEAKGWLSKLFVKPGVGLFGKIKWTDIGRKLIENRVFRWLSPSWLLDKDTKEPTQMTSVALTNKPSQAGRIEPIVNSAPVELTDDNIITMEMTKEELIELIKQTIIDLKKEKKVEELEEAIEAENECHENIVENLEQEKQEVEAGIIQNSEPAKTEETDDEKKEETAMPEPTIEAEVTKVEESAKAEEPTENACDDYTKAENAEEKKDDEEKEDEEEKKEEVIPLEALNSAPKTDGIDIVKGGTSTWQKLSGQEFIDWVNGGMK